MPLFPTVFEETLFVSLVLLWIMSEMVGIRIASRTPHGGPAGDVKGHGRNDKGSNLLLRTSLYASIIIAFLLAAEDAARMPEWSFYLGAVLMVIGIVVRQWAVLTLGRFFTLDLSVQSGQRVVDRGPYRFVRHPSYLGMSLTALGIGMALRSWSGVLAIVVLFGLALWYRMRVEERFLVAELGDDYVQYMKRTKRLIPFVL